LLAGSPAVDKGDPAAAAGVGTVPIYDQRGAPFGRVFNGDAIPGARIDIGAFELQPIVGPALPGDYNQNGIVDAADYTVWRDRLGGSVAAYSGADGSGNGIVDAADYDLWKMHFGQVVPTSGAGAATALAEPVAPVDSSAADPDPGLLATAATPRPEANEIVAERQTSANTIRSPLNGGLGQAVILELTPPPAADGLRDEALLTWLALQPDSQPRRDDFEHQTVHEDQATDEPAEFLFDAVDEVFETLSLGM
jgi:hypothetical protein